LIALITALGWIAAALTICGIGYTIVAGIATVLFLRRAKRAVRDLPAVTVIKPLHGAHDGLRESLERFCDQDYPGEVQIVFGVHDARDPAISVVRALQAAHPLMDIDLVIDARLYGSNRKASNLINISTRAKHEILILSDSDIIVDRRYLRTVVSALAEPGVGAVSCLYVGRSDGSLWSRLSAMAIDYQFLPSAVVGKALGLAQPCFGSTIAIRAGVLAKIGGFAAFADHLADDYEIGRAVRAQGYRIAIPPMVVSHICPESNPNELLLHELRWGRTVRQIDPPGYAGSLITHPLPLALLSTMLLGFAPSSVGLLFFVLALRISLKFCVDASTGARAGAWWLIPPRDVLSFAVFLASFAVNTVGWQGRRFRVNRDGVLSHT